MKARLHGIFCRASRSHDEAAACEFRKGVEPKMDNPNNTSPNPKILTAASWLMIVVGILVMIHGGMNVAYCADADRLRTIAG